MRPGAAIQLTSRPAIAHRPAARQHLRGAVALALPLFLLACTADPPPADPRPSETATPITPPEARAQLAALAAAAQDRHFTASYTLSVPGRADRTVTVTNASDHTWRVDIPAGALGGTADVSIAQTADGIHQCALPSAHRPEPATCVLVAAPGQSLPADIDPRVQHPFTDWRGVFTDRRAALAVSTSPLLPGTQGVCFAVESTSASLGPPLDVGIYCYAPDGTLTGARLAYGTLVLVGAPTAAPATVALPGPVVARAPLSMAAPPPEDLPPAPSAPAG